MISFFRTFVLDSIILNSRRNTSPKKPQFPHFPKPISQFRQVFQFPIASQVDFVAPKSASLPRLAHQRIIRMPNASLVTLCEADYNKVSFSKEIVKCPFIPIAVKAAAYSLSATNLLLMNPSSAARNVKKTACAKYSPRPVLCLKARAGMLLTIKQLLV